MTEPAVPAPGLRPADERGDLRIDDSVLRKIAEYGADQVPGILRSPRTLAGLDMGSSGSSARVRVGVGAPAPVDIRLELTLRYPASVRSVVADVRTRVAEDLRRLAGHEVRTLDVTVAGLRRPAPAPRLA